MADWIDRMLADGLAKAGGLFAQEQNLGQQMWSVGGWRCYGHESTDGGTLKLRDSGSSLTYELVGMSPLDLK